MKPTSLISMILTRLLVGCCLFIGGLLHAQDRMLLPWGSPYSQVEAAVSAWPGFIKTGIWSQNVKVENSCMVADYQFAENELVRMDIVRKYGSYEQAREGLQVYLVWLERKGDMILPQALTRHHELHMAIADEGGVEMEIKKTGWGGELVIHAWRKTVDHHSPSQDILSLAL